MPAVTSMLLTTDAVGGVWQYTCALAQALRQQGVDCHIAVLGPPPSAALLSEASSIPVTITGLKLDWLASTPDELHRAAILIEELALACRATTLHLHSPAYAEPACRLPQIAVVHSCVASWWRALRTAPMPADFVWRKNLLRQGMNAAQAIVAPSAAFAAEIELIYDIVPEVVHNGIPNPAAVSADRELDVLAAGRAWDEAKGFEILDMAAQKIPAPVRIAGPLSGPQNQSFRPRHLQVLGMLDRAGMLQAQRRAGIFVAPSRYEPFGLAVLEAATLATPLVLSDIPIFRELWHDAAVFVDPRDSQAWTRTLTDLLQDRTRRGELGQAAQKRAGRYTARNMARRTLQLHDACRQRALAA